MTTAAWLILMLLVAPPPLTDAQREQLLDARVDPHGHNDAAFDALLDHTRTWDDLSDSTAQPRSLTPADLSRATRGEAWRIDGRLERVEPIGSDRPAVERWLLRVGPDDTIIVVYVDRRPEGPNASPPAPGSSVSITARYYQAMLLPVDGELQPFHAFVGALPRIEPATTPVNVALVALPVGLGVLLILLIVRRMMVRSHLRMRAPVRLSDDLDDTIDDDDAALPPEPVEALRALRRRATNQR
jgi:hypothetical protein